MENGLSKCYVSVCPILPVAYINRYLLLDICYNIQLQTTDKGSWNSLKIFFFSGAKEYHMMKEHHIHHCRSDARRLGGTSSEHISN